MNMSKLGNYTPGVIFNYSTFADNFCEQNGAEVYTELEKIREKLKKSSGYHWDNTHFYIENNRGNIILAFSISPDGCLSFWEAKGSRSSVGNWNLKEFTAKKFHKIVDEITKGNLFCSDCGKWKKKGKTYSYAGWVCVKCFNPKKHLPPDTTGS